jgi:hypothetical protein
MRSLIGAALAALLAAKSAAADPVWDPTEIARLSQQAAQLATNLSTTIDTLRTFDKLAIQIGAMGGRTWFTSTAPTALANYATLPSMDAPVASDAFSLLSPGSPSATQLRQNRQIWLGAYQRAAAEGLAVSQVANQDAGSAISRSKTLADATSGAQDLRSDIQANSAVGLAVLQELGAVQAVLALLLEQQSLARLTSIANNGAGS